MIAAPSSPLPVDRELTLHYIDKLHNSLLESGRATSRSVGLVAVLSIGVLALSMGIATLQEEVAIGGAVLAMQSWVVLIGLSLVLAGAYFHLWGTAAHDHRVGTIILQQYSLLGFDPPLKETREPHPLAYADVFTTITNLGGLDLGAGRVGRFLSTISGLVGTVALVLGPIAVECVALNKILQLQPRAVWVWFLYGSITLLMILYFVTVFSAFNRMPNPTAE